MSQLIAAVATILALVVVVPSAPRPAAMQATPAALPGTPRPAATPFAVGEAEQRGGVGSQLAGQQAAAQATIAAYATREAAQTAEIAALRAALANAQVTATALVVVAANTVLDPERESVVIQTDLGGMLNDDPQALAAARETLAAELARFPPDCRAGFTLISGKAPSIAEGVALAQRVDALLRDLRPAMFTTATGAEFFALPNEEPIGEVTIDIFFYAGCVPVG